VEAAARVQPASAGPVYTRRQPDKTALYQVLQQHLLTFEQQWTDAASGRTLPKFVTEELHLVRYFGVLSSHAASRGEVVPAPAESTPATPIEQDKPKNTSRYIRWFELLRRTLGFEIVCSKCQAPLRLIAFIQTEDIAQKILTAMHLPATVPALHPARPPPKQPCGGDDELRRRAELKATLAGRAGVDYAL
jgi:hypothetical protein